MSDLWPQIPLYTGFHFAVVPCPHEPLCRNGVSSKTIYRPDLGANVLTDRIIACGPPRCVDVTSYDSVTDSPIQWLSFHPTLMVVGALMCKRWIVQ